MTVYCDTSLLVAALATEARTSAVQHWLRRTDNIATNLWVHAEVASALAQKKRLGLLSGTHAAQALNNWEQLRRSFSQIAIEPRHLERAAALSTQSPIGLRAADALHAAIASDSNRMLATLDRKLLLACREVGVPAFNPLAD